jgi:hypothetical protein
MRETAKPWLTDQDIRAEWRVMVRWCRLFRRTDVDWVKLVAKRYRDRHPVLGARTPDSRAA